jgi:putative DNA primase/helicase
MIKPRTVSKEVTEEDIRPPEYSDDSLGVQFAERYKDELRYVAKWDKWFHWNGKQWRQDEVQFPLQAARLVCRNAASKVNDGKVGKQIARIAVISATRKLGSCNPRIAATTDQWDTDIWKLNTPDGIVDLKTGKLYDHDPADYMTKITAVGPDPKCPTAIWDAFLDRVTNKDRDLQNYMKRYFGYGLTGVVSEHAMAFLHGNGRNGKGVCLHTVSDVMGDYHKETGIDVFTAALGERHPTELANLRGARLVTATETEEGRAWAESRIKMMTGGDTISARFMRQDFFEYLPQFKLAVMGNHKPSLKTVDVAIKARINMIPFDVYIPPAERDPNLEAKLKTEWPGIMQWLIEGCLEWQSGAWLHPPQSGTLLPNTSKKRTEWSASSASAAKQVLTNGVLRVRCSQHGSCMPKPAMSMWARTPSSTRN